MHRKALRLLAWGVVLLGLAGFVLAAPLPPGFARWLVGGTLSGLAGAMGLAAAIHLWNKETFSESGQDAPEAQGQDQGKSRIDIPRIR